MVLSLVAVMALVFPLASKAVGEAGTIQSVTVFNETKNKDATLQVADKEDYLTYTLSVKNNSTALINSYNLSVNLSYVLDFSDMADKGGGTLTGSMLTYPSISIPASSTVTKSFKVRVKYYLPVNNSNNMTLTFGNTVSVMLNRPSITFNEIAPTGFNDSQVQGVSTTVKVAPKTGADMNALYFGFLFPAVYGIITNRKKILALIK